MTYTLSVSKTFTRTSAQYLASKVVADLRRMRAYYDQPTESQIMDYYTEVVELLMEGYLANVEYGFKRDNQRVVTLYYEVQADGSLADSNSGGIYARAQISGASWFSFLSYNEKWFRLSPTDQQRIQARLPFQRSPAQTPEDGDGYWTTDRSYFADGVGTRRRTFRPY